MSHFVPLKTTIKDLNILVESLVCLGFKREAIEIHEKNPTSIHDYHKQSAKAHVAIRSNYTGIPSDIGWEKMSDGTFTAHLDDFDYHRGTRYDAVWSSKLQLRYNMETSKKSFKENGWTFTETVDENKNPVLVAKEKERW